MFLISITIIILVILWLCHLTEISFDFGQMLTAFGSFFILKTTHKHSMLMAERVDNGELPAKLINV